MFINKYLGYTVNVNSKNYIKKSISVILASLFIISFLSAQDQVFIQYALLISGYIGINDYLAEWAGNKQ